MSGIKMSQSIWKPWAEPLGDMKKMTVKDSAMSDAGEKLLRDRAEKWAAANCDVNTSALVVFARAELERAAEIADGLGCDRHSCADKIAAAIRKLKE